MTTITAEGTVTHQPKPRTAPHVWEKGRGVLTCVNCGKETSKRLAIYESDTCTAEASIAAEDSGRKEEAARHKSQREAERQTRNSVPATAKQIEYLNKLIGDDYSAATDLGLHKPEAMKGLTKREASDLIDGLRGN